LFLAACIPPDTTPPGPVTRLYIELESKDVRLEAIGDTVRIRAVAFDANHRRVKDAKIEYESLTPEIVSVDSTGLVTALAAGKGRVRAFVRNANGEIEASATAF